jgi:hypothetical protein
VLLCVLVRSEDGEGRTVQVQVQVQVVELPRLVRKQGSALARPDRWVRVKDLTAKAERTATEHSSWHIR